MRNIAKQQFLCVHKLFEALSHVIEVVHEGLKLITLEDTGGRTVLFYARSEVAVREFPCGPPQANDRPGEDEHENKGSESADGDRHRQLREAEVKQVVI